MTQKKLTKREMDAWTARMDGWFGDPYDPERFQFYLQCRECSQWTLFQGSHERYGEMPKKARCKHCGSSRLDPQSCTSKRTFDPARAKKRKVA